MPIGSPRMRHIFISLLLCLFSGLLLASDNSAALKKVDPTALLLLQAKSSTVSSLAADLHQSLALSDRHQLRVKKEGKEEGGGRYVVFQQYFDDVPVYGQELTVSLNDKAQVVALSGTVATGFDRQRKLADENSHALSAKDALSKAKKMLGEAAAQTKNDVLVANTTSTERVIYLSPNKQFHTAYFVNFYIDKGDDKAVHPYFVIDAETGEVLQQWQKAKLSRAVNNVAQRTLTPVEEQPEQSMTAAVTAPTQAVQASKPRPAMPILNIKNNLSGQAAISALGDNLSAVAAFYGKTAQELEKLLLEDSTVRLDSNGYIFYVDHILKVEPDINAEQFESSMATKHEHLHAHADEDAADVAVNAELDAPVTAQLVTPLLADAFSANSKPGASKIIYLDFDGHTVTGTRWNTSRNIETFVQAPFDKDGDPSSFNDAERTVILDVWRQVANDFASFDVNVTTQYPGEEAIKRTSLEDQYYGIRVVISPSNMQAICGSCSGVASLGSFDRMPLNSQPDPAFTFAYSYSSASSIAGTVSHEVGHTLSLIHDGHVGGDEYYTGHGLWNTIMGTDVKPIKHWSRGEYTGANNLQDDLAVMASYIPYRVDDHAGTRAEATFIAAVTPNSSGVIQGIIERTADVDFFRLSAQAGAVLNVKITPAKTTLHAKATLYRADGSAVMTLESTDSDTGISEINFGDCVETGSGQQVYFLAVTGVGSGNVSENGYSGYGSLGNYTINVSMANQASIYADLPYRATVGSPSTFYAHANSNRSLLFESVTPNVCVLGQSYSDSATLDFLNNGTCTVRVKQEAYLSLLMQQQDFSFPVKRGQVINVPAVADRLVSEGDFNVAVSATSGLSIGWRAWSTNLGVCQHEMNLNTIIFTVEGRGRCLLKLVQPGNNLYWPAEEVRLAFNVRNFNQQISFGANPGPRAYGSGNFQVSATTTSTSVVVFSSLTPLTCTVTGSTVSILAVGFCTIAANAAMDFNYLAAPQVVQNISITKGFPSLRFTPLANKTYGDAPFAVSATTIADVSISYSSKTPLVCSVTGNMVTIISAGSCRLRAESVETENWYASNTEYPFTVHKASQSIALGNNPTSKVFGDSPFTLLAETSSSSQVIFASVTPVVCEVDNNVLRLVSAGTCGITVNAAADINYFAATQRTFYITVNKAQQVVTLFGNPTQKTFGDSAFTLSAVTSSNSSIVFSSLSPQICAVSGNLVTIIKSGQCVVAVNAAADLNYLAADELRHTITINKAAQTIFFENIAGPKDWHSGSFAVNVSSTSSLPIVLSSYTSSVCTVTAGIVTLRGIGDCVLAANSSGNENYLPAQEVRQTVSVVKAKQVISFEPINTIGLGATQFFVTASGGLSENPVTFSSLTPAVCTVSASGLVNSIDTGTCSLQADQAGNDFYLAAEPVIRDVEILLDSDMDGIADINDNCVTVANPRQLDYNGNGIGDACNDFMPMPEVVTGELKADKTGSTVVFAGDFDGDGYGDFAVATPGYDIPKTASNKKLIKDVGRVVVNSGRTGEQLASAIGVKAKDMLGFALAGNADIDGDGLMDVVAGSPRADANGLIDSGSVTVLFGGTDQRKRHIKGDIAKALFGSALALADVNADGYADIIVGSPKDDVAGLKDNGSVWVFSGRDLNYALARFVGKSAKAYAGTSVAAADIDGIAGAEIVIGAANDDVSFGSDKRVDAGSVKVYRMTDHYDQPYAAYYGNVTKAYLGKSLAVADVNADGFADVIAGAPGDDNGKLKDVGSVSVFFGNKAAARRVHYGAVAKAGLGNSVAAADVNGDGFADVIAGAAKDDKLGKPVLRDVGSVSVWSGANEQPLGAKIYGDKAKDLLGSSVSAGDINGDGKADVIIGIPGLDDPINKKAKDRGLVWIVDGASF